MQLAHCSLIELSLWKLPPRPAPLLFRAPKVRAFPKATLGILDRPPTLLGSWQACLFSSDGLLKATLGILDRPQTVLGSWQACLFSWPVSGLPLLFLWASESNVRHCGPPPNPSRQLAGQPATLGILDRPQTVLGSWQACLFSSLVLCLPLLFLWASESNVRHFGPASNPSQRLWPTPASQPCLRQAGAWGGSLWNVQPVHCSYRRAATGTTQTPLVTRATLLLKGGRRHPGEALTISFRLCASSRVQISFLGFPAAS